MSTPLPKSDPAPDKTIVQMPTDAPQQQYKMDSFVTDRSPVMNAEQQRKIIQQGEPNKFVDREDLSVGHLPARLAPIKEMSEKEKRVRVATILSRGIIHDRMHVPLPPHLYGEWIRDDPMEIDRMRALGFEIDTEYAANRSLHGDGTGASRVADVIFMTCPREQKDLIEEVRAEHVKQLHGRKGDKTQREEANFAEGTRKSTQGVIPTYAESETREARKSDIEAALSVMKAQTTPQ